MVYKVPVGSPRQVIDMYCRARIIFEGKAGELNRRRFYTVLCRIYSFSMHEKRGSPVLARDTLGPGFTHSFSIIFTNGNFRFENCTAAV
jgi:hypothetical protein